MGIVNGGVVARLRLGSVVPRPGQHRAGDLRCRPEPTASSSGGRNGPADMVRRVVPSPTDRPRRRRGSSEDAGGRGGLTARAAPSGSGNERPAGARRAPPPTRRRSHADPGRDRRAVGSWSVVPSRPAVLVLRPAPVPRRCGRLRRPSISRRRLDERGDGQPRGEDQRRPVATRRRRWIVGLACSA